MNTLRGVGDEGCNLGFEAAREELVGRPEMALCWIILMTPIFPEITTATGTGGGHLDGLRGGLRWHPGPELCRLDSGLVGL